MSAWRARERCSWPRKREEECEHSPGGGEDRASWAASRFMCRSPRERLRGGRPGAPFRKQHQRVFHWSPEILAQPWGLKTQSLPTSTAQRRTVEKTRRTAVARGQTCSVTSQLRFNGELANTQTARGARQKVRGLEVWRAP